MKEQMTPEQRIDAALDSVLRASGSALKYFSPGKTLDEMRKAMRAVMVAEYIAGLHSEQEVMNRHNTEASRPH